MNMATPDQARPGHMKLAYRLISPRYYVWHRAWRVWRRGAASHEEELKLLRCIVPRDRVAIDVGANRGIYTFFLSRLAAKTVAYEPSPALALFLKEAHLPNTEVRESGVSNSAGEQTFFVHFNDKDVPQYNVGHLGGGHPAGRRGMEFPVRTVRLDDEGLSNVGFIKIDVEGHEWEVIDGARDLLARCRPNLIVEILEGAGDRKAVARNKIAVLLDELGYEIYVFSHGGLRPLCDASLKETMRNFVFLPRNRIAATETMA